ncbi:hypothetical protein RHOSPDRAFT_26015 [Rhodotorula sp. JG-1b]|nr:hypothetical protein RHOSPDRAFT_26015 [Rhodotorula sp. JG-1b]
MEPVKISIEGNADGTFTTGLIPGSLPFSRLPDELIRTNATHLYPPDGFRRASWAGDPAYSLDYFYQRGQADPPDCLAVTLHTTAPSAPLLLTRLSLYGHHVKFLAVYAKCAWNTITLEEQLTRIVASLTACENLQSLTMSGIQQRGDRGRGSLAAVFQTLAERAPKLKYLAIDPFWSDWIALGGIENLEGVLRAAVCLKRLGINCSNGARWLQARHFFTFATSPGLDEPATPLETVMIYELSVENLAELQQFYEPQPHKTLTHIDIGSPGNISWREPEWAQRRTEPVSGLGQCPRIVEWKLRLQKVKPLLARCVAWADKHGITITARWYGPEMYEWFGPDMIEGIRAEMRA